VVNYPYGTFLVAAQPHWGFIVLAFPEGEDGSRPERKKFLGQVFTVQPTASGTTLLGLIHTATHTGRVGGKDKGKRIKVKNRDRDS